MINVDQRLTQMLSKLKERGCRITPQRLAILRVFAASEGHPSVEQVFARVKRNFPTTSLATVYNTVTLLKEIGEIQELNLSDGSSRYDGNNPHPHPHVICVECKNILDPEGIDLGNLPEEVARRTGYRVLNHRLDFFGVCPACQEKRAR